ncbi:MAG: hypothetical protein M0C28_36740 [Candidatus Moduliflexus flocculans]|nr:hypothetical protein [Candidatus Moduliflexus flocculans]
METILDEARRLRDMGVRELILIAQDTTDYGHDLGMKDGLAILLEQLDRLRARHGLDPRHVCLSRLCDGPSDRRDGIQPKQILPYLDMPLQHAHPKTLYRMKRPSNIDWVHKTLGKMRVEN